MNCFCSFLYLVLSTGKLKILFKVFLLCFVDIPVSFIGQSDLRYCTVECKYLDEDVVSARSIVKCHCHFCEKNS